MRPFAAPRAGGAPLRGEAAQKVNLACAMVIFGTIGVFVRHIPYSSGVIALARSAIGTAFLLVWMRARRIPLDGASVRRNLPLLAVSATAMAFNWILLFEAYRYTTVAVATLCYYLAPVFVIAASPFALGERLTARKALCVFAALVGMVFVSGVPESGLPDASQARGILYGVGAAALYATVMLLNKRMRAIGVYDRTVWQLGISAAAMLVYVLATGRFSALQPAPAAVGMTILVGIVHTGIAYALYFGSLGELRAQTVAIMSYIDPVVAILLSVLLLREPTTALAMLGAALVLGSTLVSEAGS